jgi:hypothetical protein
MVDKKALKTLLNVFSFYGTKGFAPGKSKEFVYAKSAGLMFDNIRMSHDDGIAWLLQIRHKVQKEKVTDLFLSSLSSRRLDWRSGLSAYAIAMKFPDHKLENKEDWGSYCRICGDHSYEIEQERELNLYNHKRFSTGGYESMHSSPDALAFYLEQIVRLEHKTPTKDDLAIWNEIVNLLCRSQDFKSANDLERGLSTRKIFKSNKIERRTILETLSLAGIIASEEHKGYFPDFIPQIKREKRPNGASPNDWCYPILWWKGSDGINTKALEFWFKGYAPQYKKV